MEITLNSKQQTFCNSSARFPAFVGGWGCGKRLDVRQEIKTTKGWTILADIKAGDYVYNLEGKPVKVLIAHPIIIKDGYELQFDSGEKINADAEHLWFTQTARDKKRGLRGSVKTTLSIINSIRTTNNYETNHRIPTCSPIEGKRKRFWIEPYTLGAWLGDGHSNTSTITSEDAGVLTRIQADGYSIKQYPSQFNNYYISNGANPKVRYKNAGGVFVNDTLNYLLGKIGVRNNKHIPLDYMDASINQRFALLQGLMDTDGYADVGGNCEYCSVNKTLADNVLELVNSLGIKAKMLTGKATIDGRYISEKYRVVFKTKKKIFGLERKQSRVDNSTDSQMSRRTNRFIKSYTIVKDIAMRCLTVDSSDGLFLVGRTFIPTHNTMCGILRGLLLSKTYHNNLGLIVRKKFTDLRDSTLKDFERYTGLSVKKDAKEITLDGCNSTIMFRHGEELSGLQNVNLGWFMMEQAEEFDTAEQFDLLRGRLRRQEADIRQGMVIANTAGHNWVWDRWKDNPQTNYELVEANIFDNQDHLPADTLADWEQLKIESPKKYNRYVLNSWEDYDLEGAFYASLLSDALKQGRTDIVNLWCKDQPVYTFWDLGLRASDTTAIWCVQFIGDGINLIDYYENYGEGIDHYVGWLDSKKYIYGKDYLPHDGKNRLQGRVIETREEILKSLRHCPTEIVLDHRIIDRIESARIILSKCKFDVNCKRGLNCLNHYKKKKNIILSTDEMPVFAPEPLHDWSSNGADAFGYMAVAHRYMSFAGKRFKSNQDVPVKSSYTPYNNNILRRGLRRVS